MQNSLPDRRPPRRQASVVPLGIKSPTGPAVAVAGGLALLLVAGAVQAAATCSISTSPNPPTINVGQSVAFTGSVSGKTPKT
jgi:hypothetical protein